MMLAQAPSGALPPTWTRAAVHDTVAAIVRQSSYRRDVQRTLFDRLLRWIFDLFDRLFSDVRGLPHGRQLAVLAVAVLLLLIAGRVLYARRLRAHGFEEGIEEPAEGRALGDPWRDAERLANAGQFTEAAHALYRSIIAMLAARGLVRPHASKTSGDYTRELRRRNAPAEAAFRRFGSRYDRIIYGTGICDAANYAALLAEARIVFGAAESERAA
jgi:uncharacterized protein DUF4129